MNVIAAVLTFNPYATGRIDLLEETIRTLAAGADRIWLVDNGSEPDEIERLRARFGPIVENPDANTTCGHGSNLQARVLKGAVGIGRRAHRAQPDETGRMLLGGGGRGNDTICVHSDDDMVWRAGWRDLLLGWWGRAPDRVLLTGGHIEPEYPWNPVTDRMVYGGTPGLVRATTGAASWTYRASRSSLIFPIPERVQGTGDVPGCERLTALNYQIAQLDLATHAGTESTWGNRTVALYGDDNTSAMARLRGPS